MSDVSQGICLLLTSDIRHLTSFRSLRPLLKHQLFAALLLALCALTSAAAADSVNTKERTVTQVAEGVYVIRHPDAPDGFPQGNTTVVVGDHEVLVVDSCYLPSNAREDIAQIRKWT